MHDTDERVTISLTLPAECWEQIGALALRTGQRPEALAAELLERGAALMLDLVERREAQA